MMQLRDIYLKVEQDEILLQMKENTVSDEFRRQRAEELIGELVSMEQEEIIAKLSQINAVLKTQLKQQEARRGESDVVQSEEMVHLKKSLFELESALEKETTVKKFLESENDKLNSKLKQQAAHHQEILKMKDAQLVQQTSLYESEIKSLKRGNTQFINI
jgi:hypothetical protein